MAKDRTRKRRMKLMGRKRWFRSDIGGKLVATYGAEVLSFSSVAIYRSEFERILKEVAASPECETGGELFGFYRDDGTPVVCYAIGPGPQANRQLAFFNQDLEYLVRVGGWLGGRFGLEHIGEWHSHHRLGLACPSRHDAASVANGIRIRGRRRFILCVGNIVGSRASLGAFAFTADSGTVCRPAAWQVVDGTSPYRESIGEI